MDEAHFNLIFKGEVEPGIDLGEARNTLEDLFEFDPENPIVFFDGQNILLGENMNARTANSFLQALAAVGVIAHLFAVEENITVKNTHAPRLEQRRKTPNHRVKVRSGAIIPDWRVSQERRG